MSTRQKYDVRKLRNPEVRVEFVLELSNGISSLAGGEPENEGEALNNEKDDKVEGKVMHEKRKKRMG